MGYPPFLMAMRSIRDNTLAGLFVATGLVLGVWVSFWLGDWEGGGQTHRLIVKFPLAIGAAGLKPGSAVTLGGQRIGRVTEVTFGPAQTRAAGAPAAAAPQTVEVTVQVPASITLLRSAQFSLERPLIGSVSSINITGMGSKMAEEGVEGRAAWRSGEAGGTEEREDRPLEDGDVVAGGLAPPSILTQAGVTPEDIASVRRSISTLEETLARVRGAIANAAPDAEQAVKEAREITQDLKGRLAGWGASVDTSLTRVEEATAEVGPILTRVDEVVVSARALLESAQKVADENRQPIADMVTALRSAAVKFDGETMTLVERALSDASEALDALKDTLGEVHAIVGAGGPQLARILANLRLMSDNAKLASIEVRSQPWRALHTPTNKELSTQALYDSTRAFAEASTELRGASDSLSAILKVRAGSAAMAPESKVLQDAADLLRGAMERYKDSEQRLLNALIREESK